MPEIDPMSLLNAGGLLAFSYLVYRLHERLVDSHEKMQGSMEVLAKSLESLAKRLEFVEGQFFRSKRPYRRNKKSA